MRDIFIIGSKGIPSAYGGFETFVDNLVQHQKSKDIQYHIACMKGMTKTESFPESKEKEFKYQRAHCFTVDVPAIGPAKAVYYDLAAFNYCLRYIKQNECKNPVIYILACRIGPFIHSLKKKLQQLGGTMYVNPDGHEWKRSKWNAMIKKYWKLSEKLMVKWADLLICDSKNIEKYIQKEYIKYSPVTTYIAYGTNVDSDENKEDNDKLNQVTRDKLQHWFQKHGVKPQNYFLIVGRFVPENNYELMITEFMKAKTDKDLVIITNVEHNKFYKHLQEKTKFEQDHRIKFVGTVYDAELLGEIRKNATGYLHGHAVGGTNPSLLEALATTDVNLLYHVGFNKEVAEDAALYFGSQEMDLVNCIHQTETMTLSERTELGLKAKNRIKTAFSHEKIGKEYENVFLKKA